VAASEAPIGRGAGSTACHSGGAVVTLLAVCDSTRRESYLDIVMVRIVSALIALVAVIALSPTFGSFQNDASAGEKPICLRDNLNCSMAVLHSIIAASEFRSCERQYSDL
jgi:hypothetical protein